VKGEGVNEIPHSNRAVNIPSHLHARPGIIDPERFRVNLDAYKPIARLFGNLYAHLGEKFVLKPQSLTEWEAENGVDVAADSAETES